MNAQLNFALRETLWASKWVILLALFVLCIIFCIDVIIYVINNEELMNSFNGALSLSGMLYSIGSLIVCILFIINLMNSERQYR